MTRPTIDTVWGSTGSTSDPGDAKMNLGWAAEIPDFEIQNFWQERVDLLLEQLEKRGILEWDAVTTYEIGSIALASDNSIYRAITATNINNDPIASPTNWTLLNDIPDDFIDQDMLANNSVGTAQIIDLNVTTAKINALAITTAKIDDLAVTTAKINDLAVTNAKINDLAVTNAKIGSLAVSTGKLGALAVTPDKIATNAVETVKINALAVTPDKIATNAVETVKINNLAVTTAKIDDQAVTTAKLDDGSVTSVKLGVVDADQITYDPASDPIVTATDVQAAIEEVSTFVADTNIYKVKPSNQTVTGVLFEADDDLGISVDTNSVYVFTANLSWGGTAINPAIKFLMPAGSDYRLTLFLDVGTVLTQFHRVGTSVSETTEETLGNPTDQVLSISLVVTTTNAGVVVPHYRGQLGDTIIVLESSWMKGEKFS